MKVLPPALLLLVAAISHAGAAPSDRQPGVPTKATADEQRDIRSALAEAFKKEKDLREINSAIRAAQASDDAAAEVEYTRQFESKKAEMLEDLQRAVGLIGRAYNVEPRDKDRTIMAGRMAGRSATWRPRVQLDEAKVFRYEPRDGKTMYFPSKFPKPAEGEPPYGETGGNTQPDGEVLLPMGLLRMAHDYQDPGVVALVLHHEAIHFNQLVTEGWRRSLQENEARAWTETRKAVAVLIGDTPHDPNWRQFWRDTAAAKGAEYVAAIRRGEKREPWPTDEENDDLEREFDLQLARLADIRAAQDALRERSAQQERDRQRALEESMVVSPGDLARSTPPPPPPGRADGPPLAGARPAPPRSRQGRPPLAEVDRVAILEELAVTTCGNPGAITQAGLDMRFSWFADGEDYSVRAAARLNRLTGCARTLLLELLELNRTGRIRAGINAAWLSDRARELTAPPPAPPPPPPPARPAPAPREPSESDGGRNCYYLDGRRWCDTRP